MVSSTGHDGSEPVLSSKSPGEDAGSEPVLSSKSPDSGSTAELPKGSAPATPDISAEKNGSSELVAGQSKAIRLRQLPSLIPGRAPIFVNEKQYESIIRRRARRARIQANRLNVKNRRPGGSTRHSIEANDDQGRTNAGISEAPITIPAVDFHGPFIATNEDEEHVGEAAYDSILNLKSPDFTTMLRIMMGDKYDTDVPEEFKNVACLDSPDPTILLMAMNDLSYDEAADDGYYDVEKMLLKISGWL